MLKQFFEEVSAVTLCDEPVHDFEEAVYDEEKDVPASDDDEDDQCVIFEQLDGELDDDSHFSRKSVTLLRKKCDWKV